MNTSYSKCLIAYFSRKGNNYVNGRIVNLPVGNTEIVAQKIKDLTGGDLFEIKTSYSYPLDYYEATEVAKTELENNLRPELVNKVKNMEVYDLIFLGYPIWWNTFPTAVFSFLESYDFSTKIIAPFCTHEGSGAGRSVQDIQNLCPQTIVLHCLTIRGSMVNNSETSVQSWLSKTQLIK